MPLTATPATDITPASVQWLWKPYIARGKLAILDGDPGTGKSFVALDLAARLSRGTIMPGGHVLARPHTTLLLSAEDDAALAIKERYETTCPCNDPFLYKPLSMLMHNFIS